MPITIPDDLTQKAQTLTERKPIFKKRSYDAFSFVRIHKIVISILCLLFACFCIYKLVNIGDYSEQSYRFVFWFGGLGALALFEAIYCFATRRSN